MRPNSGKVAGDMNLNVLGQMRVRIVEFDGTELLDDNGVGSSRRVFEVKSIAVQSFGNLLGLRVIGEQAHWTVAIREEIDRVTGPHGRVVVGIITGNFCDARIL